MQLRVDVIGLSIKHTGKGDNLYLMSLGKIKEDNISLRNNI